MRKILMFIAVLIAGAQLLPGRASAASYSDGDGKVVTYTWNQPSTHPITLY